NKDTRIFLRADKGVDYGEFMTVMNLLRHAGYLKIALVGLETLPQPVSSPDRDVVQPTPGAVQ
ncbi:MAG: TonB system transport protein ExbD, partial [Rhizobium pusense]|nr:TonB system transport protein ExbD [Agrobacterium pusense]